MHHSSALNNRGPILAKLQAVLTQSPIKVKRALEVASGSGAHIEVFAPAFPDIKWQPSEYVPGVTGLDEDESYKRFGRIARLGNELTVIDEALGAFPNVSRAKALNLLDPTSFFAFEEHHFGLVHIGNTFHVCHKDAIENFFQLCSRVLALDTTSLVTIYGPFKRSGEFTTESNANFDVMLRGKNPDFGVRDLETEVVPSAARHGFSLKEVNDMPSNNFLLTFSRL